VALLTLVAAGAASAQDIVHDAEYYILEAQNGERWAAEDKELDAKLAQLREKYGQPPNIIHVMWDDTSFGDVGIPAINKIRGFETPNINRMAEEGIMFTRMYTEVGCTPSRAAVLTGRHAVRSGMYVIGFPVEYSGMRAEEVTTAEVLSDAGYATAFFGKLHLGDIEEAYAHNQGFDETLFGIYNQIFSLYNEVGEAANATMGLQEHMLVPDPYKLDDTFVPKGYVGYIEGKKGEPGYEWRGTAKEDYDAFDPETKVRAMDFIHRNVEADKPFFLSWWPMLTSFMPSPEKKTLARGLYTDNMQYNVDAFIGELMDELERLAISSKVACGSPPLRGGPESSSRDSSWVTSSTKSISSPPLPISAEPWARFRRIASSTVSTRRPSSSKAIRTAAAITSTSTRDPIWAPRSRATSRNIGSTPTRAPQAAFPPRSSICFRTPGRRTE